MNSKTIGVRFPENLIAELKADGGRFNTVVIERLQNSLADERAAALDIKGIFTDNEWAAICMAFNNVTIDNSLLYSRELLINHITESKAAEKACGDISDLCLKITKLTRLQVVAVLRRVINYYRNPKAQTVAEWINY